MRIDKLLVTALSIAAPHLPSALAAQAVPRQAPPSSTSSRLDAGFVVGGDWLQVNAMPLDRDAMHSASFDLAWRHAGWSYDAGFLRIARDFSTVQGGTGSVGRLVYWGPVLFVPAVGLFMGESYRSVDSTGYDFVGPGGVVGHTPRYSYSDGFSFGGGASVTVEYPIFRGLALRVLAAEWVFSGHPLEGDRARTVIGAGLSLRVRQ